MQKHSNPIYYYSMKISTYIKRTNYLFLNRKDAVVNSVIFAERNISFHFRETESTQSFVFGCTATLAEQKGRLNAQFQ